MMVHLSKCTLLLNSKTESNRPKLVMDYSEVQCHACYCILLSEIFRTCSHVDTDDQCKRTASIWNTDITELKKIYFTGYSFNPFIVFAEYVS